MAKQGWAVNISSAPDFAVKKADRIMHFETLLRCMPDQELLVSDHSWSHIYVRILKLQKPHEYWIQKRENGEDDKYIASPW